MKSNISEKEIFYSMLAREVDNLLCGIPFFSSFSPTITSFLCKWLDPYVSAFLDNEQHLDSKQLAAFASEEALDKINRFKERYEENVRKDRDNGN
jgi:hypothetical protein